MFGYMFLHKIDSTCYQLLRLGQSFPPGTLELNDMTQCITRPVGDCVVQNKQSVSAGVS